jgi:hypothetical protein
MFEIALRETLLKQGAKLVLSLYLYVLKRRFGMKNQQIKRKKLTKEEVIKKMQLNDWEIDYINRNNGWDLLCEEPLSIGARWFIDSMQWAEINAKKDKENT